ncbi:Notch-regulated ankyrin repeat-containing protein [Mizuhopecten yessoensis]|uniref:Notch-regulated ankyrin repeat-containing protein n=1 Tax=Mizuhopecten yessoensis TaxID=6573 RepID=A0A210QV30_MIZYE|nr:Notch-regulated ankyrin repeat-containing protein [Mizuhopecten yessoensis]
MNRTQMPGSQASFQRFFLEAVRNGNTDELQKILEARDEKINVNSYDTEGQTALHQSCMDGNLKLVKLLVKFGADTKLANRDGWNALHIAAFGGHQDIILYLIRAAGARTPR